MARDTLDIVIRTFGGQRAAAQLGSVRTAGVQAERAVLSLNRAFGVLSGGFALQALASYADSFTRIQNQIQLATEATVDAAAATERLLSISNETRTGIEENAQLFARLGQTQKDLGASQEELFRFTQLVGKGFAIQGTAAAGVRGATIQLTQAIGEGIVRAQEFNSIIENNRPLLVAAARGIDEAAGSVSRLRQILIAGELTSERFFRGVLEGGESLDRLFARTTPTISQAFTIFRNNLTNAIGELDRAAGSSAALAQSIIFIGNNLDTLGPLLIATAVIFTSRFLGPLLQGYGRLIAAELEWQRAVAAGRVTSLSSFRTQRIRAQALQETAAAQRVARQEELTTLQSRRDILRANLEVIRSERELNDVRVRGGVARNSAGQFVSQADLRRRIELNREFNTVRGQLRDTEQQLSRQTAAAGREARIASGSYGLLSAAIFRTGVAARIATAAVGSFRAVVAFLGGPVGAILTAVAIGFSVISSRAGRAETAVQALNRTIGELQTAFAEVGGNVEELEKRISGLSLSSAIVQAKELRDEFSSTFSDVTSELGRLQVELARSGQAAGFEDALSALSRLGSEARNGTISLEQLQRGFNRIVAATPGIEELTVSLQNSVVQLLDLERSSGEAEAIVRLLSGTATEADRALLGLTFAAKQSGQALDGLAAKSSAARDTLRGLIDEVPRLAAAARLQDRLFAAQQTRSNALQELREQEAAGSISTADVVAEQNRITSVYREAVSEINGVAQAQRDYNAARDDFADDAALAGLTSQQREVARLNSRYEELKTQAVDTGKSQAELNSLSEDYQKQLAAINQQYAKSSGGQRVFTDNLNTIAGFLAATNAELNEQIRLLRVVSSERGAEAALVDIVNDARRRGLKLGTEVQEDLRQQLNLIEDLRAGAEVYDDLNSAALSYERTLRGVNSLLQDSKISAEQASIALQETDLVQGLRQQQQDLFGFFGQGLEAANKQVELSTAKRIELVRQGIAAEELTQQQGQEQIAQIRRQGEARQFANSARGYSQLLTNAGGVFTSLANIAEQQLGRQSGAFKALFAVSQAFALANAIVQTATAVTNALASAPPPANFALAAITAAAGAVEIGTIIGQTIQAFADGGKVTMGKAAAQLNREINGRVRGPGGPRDDRILAALSNGEFVVNAKDANMNMPLLEAINSGKRVNAFADGGVVGSRRDPFRVMMPGQTTSKKEITVNASFTINNPRNGRDLSRSVSQAATQIASELREAESRDGQ